MSLAASEYLRGFMPPPGLSRSAPRDVRLTPSGRVLTGVVWLLAIAAVPIGVLLYREARREFEASATFARESVAATAVVDRLWRKNGDGNPTFAAIHFDAGDARVSGEVRMRASLWREQRVGAPIAVRFLPGDPQRWQLEADPEDGMPIWLAYVVSAGMAILSLGCGAMVRRQRTLLSNGRAAPGRITSLRKHHGAHGKSHQEIAYEFPLLGGGTATGRATASKAAAVGGTICVVYDPDRPGRNQPYPFSLVAPAGPDF
jgi:hypothetical protein